MYILSGGNGYGKTIEFNNKDEAQKMADKKNKTRKFKVRVIEVEKLENGYYKCINESN